MSKTFRQKRSRCRAFIIFLVIVSVISYGSTCISRLWLLFTLMPISFLNYIGLPVKASSQASVRSTFIRSLDCSIYIFRFHNFLHHRKYLYYELLWGYINAQFISGKSNITIYVNNLYFQVRRMSFKNIHSFMMMLGFFIPLFSVNI